MQVFYNSEVTRRYFAAAESSNEVWTPAMRPQWHLKEHIPIGSSVLDLGCGSAHAIRHLADRQPAYVGVDWSEEQSPPIRVRI